ncbi:MAG: HlyC/CorC family transporter [Deltaproteobacteria bacterium]|nr:MAG: HlyC/CorC family transporter [Deltaproteobacteria bacterium]
MTPAPVELVLVVALGASLVAWTVLAGAEATLAEARAITRAPEGARRFGRLFYELHRHPRRLLVSLALGRELALTTAAVLAVALGYQRFGLPGGVALVGVVVTLLVLRGFAAGAASGRVAAGEGTLGSVAAWMLVPLASIAAIEQRIGKRLAHAFLGEVPGGDNIFAPEELATLEEGHDELAASERALVDKAVRIDERTVRHVLTPRRDIISVPVSIGPDELLQVIRNSGCSRIPVYRGEPDDIVGILYVRDLIGAALAAGSIEGLLRQPYVISAEKPVVELFREFRTRKVHFALVLDEYGSMSGLVTMEDLLEELVGEIRDEFDDDEAPAIQRRGPRTFVVSGRVAVHDFNTRLKLHVPESGAEATIAGVVIDRLGRVPDAGETITLDGCTLTVEELDGSAIERLRVDLWPSSSSA